MRVPKKKKPIITANNTAEPFFKPKSYYIQAKNQNDTVQTKKVTSPTGSKRTMPSLGLSASESVEANLRILISSKMKVGDYLESECMVIIKPALKALIDKFTKIESNRFRIDRSWQGMLAFKSDASMKIVNGSGNIPDYKSGKKTYNQVSGLWLYFSGFDYGGKKFFLYGNKLYKKDGDNKNLIFKEKLR